MLDGFLKKVIKSTFVNDLHVKTVVYDVIPFIREGYLCQNKIIHKIVLIL